MAKLYINKMSRLFYWQTFLERQWKYAEMEVAVSGGGGGGKQRWRQKYVETENA
jgi:hypothetical protein